MGFQIEWRTNSVYVKHFKQLKIADIRTTDNILYQDPRFAHVAAQIYDFTEADNQIEDYSKVSEIVGFDLGATFWKRHMKVAVVSTDKGIEKLIDIYREGMLNTNWKVGLFATLEEAEAWCERE
ncbi:MULTISPECIES: hypothetical protein [Flavobacteriaceae]|uniref:hypothetical protein n=1 Tax=Flavobacteriaceae TaxID=49546 RepID=UPI0010AE4750|nr:MULTISPECIES: hypothetical protein [Flavobacteriaceae]NJB38014.1 hypothetical protein [Croceivirga sp. JEA036]TKD58972.1 hypothetical protein FBT53_15010 [Flavobacterium sp. ASW18X]